VLLLIRIGPTVERLPTESLFKELDEGTRPTQVSMVDPPGHGVGQLAGHHSSSLKRKSEASREQVIY
jgi:hypothetical protein